MRGHHAVADLAIDRAVIVADPGQVGLDRLTLRLRHRVGGVGGGLQRGPDRNGGDRLWLDARRRRRRHLRLRGLPRTTTRSRQHGHDINVAAISTIS